VAQIALADYATLWIILGHSVRTVPSAVLATDAGLGAVNHNSCRRILCIRLNRTPYQARRLEAMIATHGEIMPPSARVMSALHFADPPPVKTSRVPVLLVTRDDATLATDALRHIEVKTVLFTRFKRTRRNERYRL
jgi:hypothetical protein